MDELLLYRRHLLGRELYPEVPTRHHDAVRGFEDLSEVLDRFGSLDLGDDVQVLATLLSKELSKLIDVLFALHERKGHEVDVELESDEHVLTILVRECRQGQVHARQVDPFVRLQEPAVDHL